MAGVSGISVGVIGFDEVNALDLTGPLEVFAAVSARGEPAYRPHVTSLTGGPFRAESGVSFLPSPRPHPEVFDTVLIPGGTGLRRPETTASAAAWIRQHAPGARRIVSICTGAFGLAATGLLDNRPVTTHWRFAGDLQRAHPRLQVRSEALFVKDGRFYTSAGITAGLDLALVLVEEDFGPAAAAAAAKELVMFLRRPGDQKQICEALEVQSRAGDRLAAVVAWMAANPGARQSVQDLARVAGMSPRHFTRRFHDQLGTTPARFRDSLRDEQARQRLTAPECNVQALAAQLGFASDDAFSRFFQRRHGMRPSEYRRRGVASRRPPKMRPSVSDLGSFGDR